MKVYFFSIFFATIPLSGTHFFSHPKEVFGIDKLKLYFTWLILKITKDMPEEPGTSLSKMSLKI